jgi:hypothetical protein
MISSLLMSLAVFFGMVLISNSLKSNHSLTPHPEAGLSKTVLTIEELSDYFGLSIQDIESIIKRDNERRKEIISNNGVYDTYQFLPYFELPNGIKLFSITEIEKWVNFNSINHP